MEDYLVARRSCWTEGEELYKKGEEWRNNTTMSDNDRTNFIWHSELRGPKEPDATIVESRKELEADALGNVTELAEKPVKDMDYNDMKISAKALGMPITKDIKKGAVLRKHLQGIEDWINEQKRR